MTEMILLIILVLLAGATLLVLLLGKRKDPAREWKPELDKLSENLARTDSLIREEFGRNREENQRSSRENREEVNQSFKVLGETLSKTISDLSLVQKNQFELFSNQLSALVKTFDEKTRNLQEQLEKAAKDNRAEQSGSLKSFEEKFTQNVKDFNEVQRQKFDDLAHRQELIKKETEDKLKEIRDTVENKLRTLQEENSKKLDDMRRVVDEKLQETLEKRFNESFRMISERLEQVQKGLGEMQALATGVGDLKKVLSNVKTRGNLGEYQLGSILQEILSPEQYEQNASVKEGSQERVEFAIKLPGKNNNDQSLLLPVDSKFPVEDYQRLMEAYDAMPSLGPKEAEAISKQFENSVRKNAKDIRDKYINPPVTTDFAIMFVPTEGLYAEILRRTGLFESLQRDYKVTVVGPTNLVAFLSSLQMGFKTLAIEKRSSEVWEILGAVKTEFGNFGLVLEKTRKKLQEATHVIDRAGVRSRAIERKLRTVQELPHEQAVALIGESLESEEQEPSVPEDPDND
ncbi:MAG TPA: DNA recombination protein RmuC [Prolixibacteraceae bacterium]|nr:DNA recombination protein RmuC [Prolixibacteraceae bacterium]